MSRTGPLVALLAAAALAAAGCGSSDGGNAGSTPDNLSGSPIKVMQIYSGSGAGFAGFDDAVATAKAAVQAVNDAGGVNGHPLELDVCNDAFQPNQAAQCGRKAVSDKVTAVVGGYSGLGDNWMPALTKANIPCIGCAGFSSSESTSPMFYPIGISGAPSIIGEGVAACALGAKHPVVVYVSHASGAFLAQAYNSGLAACGLKAKEVAVDQGAADFTAQAAQATDGTDLIQAVIGQPDIDKFRAAVAATGKTPLMVDGYNNATAAYFTSAPGLNDKTYLESSLVPAAIGDPATKQFTDEVNKYVPNGSKLVPTEASEVTWAAVHITAQVLGKASGTDAAALLATMKQQTNLQFGPTAGVNWTQPLAQYKPLVVYSTKVYMAKVTGPNQMKPAFEGSFFDITKVPTPVG